MATNSPMLDVMIEVLTHQGIGLRAVQAAGEVIAADAAFNMRVSDEHGPSGQGTVAGMMEHIKAYNGEVQRLQAAWRTFKEAIAEGGMLRVEPHEALEKALRDLRKNLDGMN